MFLYEYEILAFDRQVAGSSPTVGVWSPYQRKGGIATRVAKGCRLHTGRPQVAG